MVAQLDGPLQDDAITAIGRIGERVVAQRHRWVAAAVSTARTAADGLSRTLSAASRLRAPEAIRQSRRWIRGWRPIAAAAATWCRARGRRSGARRPARGTALLDAGAGIQGCGARGLSRWASAS